MDAYRLTLKHQSETLESREKTRRIVWGTSLVGVAAVLFPAVAEVSGEMASYFLELTKIEQSRAKTHSDRVEKIRVTYQGLQFEDRKDLALFYSEIAVTETERNLWRSFYDALLTNDKTFESKEVALNNASAGTDKEAVIALLPTYKEAHEIARPNETIRFPWTSQFIITVQKAVNASGNCQKLEEDGSLGPITMGCIVKSTGATQDELLKAVLYEEGRAAILEALDPGSGTFEFDPDSSGLTKTCDIILNTPHFEFDVDICS